MTEKINWTAVIAAYERLQNHRAVSLESGINMKTVVQIMRRHRGVCLRCQAPVVPGKKQCKNCLEFDRARIETARNSRDPNRTKCSLCSKTHAPRSKFCETHRVSQRLLYAREFDDRRRLDKGTFRGAPSNGVQSPKEKRRRLREKYGDAGWQCWREAKGKCEACNASYDDGAIHIHHIDDDRTNNQRENFICLCFRCHRTMHLLLDSRNRRGFISLFAKTYPDKPLR
jgi:hypothetical protein